MSTTGAESGSGFNAARTTSTAHGQTTAGHGHKQSARTVDHLQVANNKLRVECDGAEGLQPIFCVIDQLDSDFGDFHNVSSFALWRRFFRGPGTSSEPAADDKAVAAL